MIADSGGTKTDWVLIGIGEKQKFTTSSGHPVNWNEEYWNELAVVLKQKVIPQKCDLYYFGAGCLQRKFRDEAVRRFEKMGFRAKVFSDLHAVGYALYGNSKGWCGIAGTGSVLFKWSRNDIVDLIGGKGHLLGDEGSGYYFGKLIRNALRENQLNLEQYKILNKTGVFVQLKDIHPKNEKKELAKIAKLLSDFKEQFREYHLQNVQLFYDSHLKDIAIGELRFSGSYVYHHQGFWISKFGEFGVKMGKILERPIDMLVEQKAYFIE